MNEESPTKEYYDYILFDVKPKSDEQPIDEKILKSFFKKIFSNIIDHPFNVLYPAHDNKCYFTSTEGQCLRIKDELFKINGSIRTNHYDIFLFNYIDTAYIKWGYYEIDHKMIKSIYNENSETIEKWFNMNFGVNIFFLNNISTNKLNMMIKADSYQKKLMDYMFGQNLKKENEEKPKKIEQLAISQKNICNDQKNQQKIAKPENKNEPSLKISNYLNKNVDIEIRNGNILDENVNAIVNAANTRLQLGGGLAGAIRERCGNRVQKECDDYLNKRKMEMFVSEGLRNLEWLGTDGNRIYYYSNDFTFKLNFCNKNRKNGYNKKAVPNCFSFDWEIMNWEFSSHQSFFLINIFSLRISSYKVMHTDSYKLSEKCKFIIHACGPRWHDYSNNNKKVCFNDLKNTFYNILIYCENKLNGLVESIAIPLISSGIFAVPKEICFNALLSGLDEYLKESNEERRALKSIKLINLDKEINSNLVDFFNKKINIKNEEKSTKKENNENENKNDICDNCHMNQMFEVLNECKHKYCIDCFNNVEQNENMNCVIKQCKKKNVKIG